jgi:hypothetical protein
MRHKELHRYFNIYSIFILALVIRFFFSLDKDTVGSDEQRYIFLSNQILKGNFDLDVGCFICAPFFPYFLAALKYLSGVYWYKNLFIIHILITSLCVFSIHKITEILFENRKIALLASLIYTIYPDTFRSVRCIGQDVFFQCFLIFSICFLLKFTQNRKFYNVIFSAIFFSLCFLTKSIILIWSPFIIFYIFLNGNFSIRTKFCSSVLYALICIVFTIPIGYYNLVKHNQYTLSSNGGYAMLWYGNSDFAYKYIIYKHYVKEPPEVALKDTSYQIIVNSLSNINTEIYSKARKTWGTPNEIENRFLQSSIQWIKENPKKFWELRKYYFFRFLIPGHKPPKSSFFLLSFIFLYSSTLYFLGLGGLYICLKKNWKKHSWLLTLYLTIFLFSIVFGTQVRFRMIIIDSFLCIYATFFLYYFFPTLNLFSKIVYAKMVEKNLNF